MASATRKRATRNVPRRVQLRRTKGWRMPVNTRKVDRTTPFGNPFRVHAWGHDRAVALHRAWILGEPLPDFLGSEKQQLARRRREVLAALESLRGKNLACWCPSPKDGEPDSCHAAILLQLANA